MKVIIYALLIFQSLQLSGQINKKLQKGTWRRDCNDSISNGGYWDKDRYFFTNIDFKKHGKMRYNNMCNLVRQLSTFPASPRFVKYKAKKDTLFFYTNDSIIKYKFSIVKEKDTLYEHKKESILFTRYSLLLTTSDNNKYLFESLEIKEMNGEPARKVLRRNRKKRKPEKTS